jgi:hypothetical protein
MREFREQVAAMRSGYMAFQQHLIQHRNIVDPALSGEEQAREDKERLFEFINATRPPYYVIRLLIAEKGLQYAKFRDTAERLMSGPSDQEVEEFTTAAENILLCERAAIEARRWRAWLRRGLCAAKKWRPWSQFLAWLQRDPPRFPI